MSNRRGRRKNYHNPWFYLEKCNSLFESLIIVRFVNVNCRSCHVNSLDSLSNAIKFFARGFHQRNICSHLCSSAAVHLTIGILWILRIFSYAHCSPPRFYHARLWFACKIISQITRISEMFYNMDILHGGLDKSTINLTLQKHFCNITACLSNENETLHPNAFIH